MGARPALDKGKVLGKSGLRGVGGSENGVSYPRDLNAAYVSTLDDRLARLKKLYESAAAE